MSEDRIRRFQQSQDMEEIRVCTKQHNGRLQGRAEELLKLLAHAFGIEWHVVNKKIVTLWPLESQNDQNFLLQIVMENLENDPEFLKVLLADKNRNYFVRRSISHTINDWPEFTKQRSSKLLKLLDRAGK